MTETHERLRHEWYDLWHSADPSKPKPWYEDWLEDHIAALEADNARLREALKLGLDMTEQMSPDVMVSAIDALRIVGFRASARAALEQKP